MRHRLLFHATRTYILYNDSPMQNRYYASSHMAKVLKAAIARSSAKVILHTLRSSDLAHV